MQGAGTGLKLVSACLLAWGLAACGGGGGGGGGDSAPAASAGSSSSLASSSSSSSSLASSASSSSSSVKPVPAGWASYTADTLPTAAAAISLGDGTTSSFKLCASTGCNAAYASVANGILSVDTQSESTPAEQSYFQYDNAFSTAGYPKTATVLTRMRGNAVANLKGLTLDMAFSQPGESGPRVQMSLLPDNDSNGFYLSQIDQSATGDNNVYAGNIDATAWHVYQVSVTFTSAKTGTVRVYMDGSSTPIIDKTLTDFRQATAIGQNYLRIGEESTSEHAKGDFDWVVWTSDAAYTPAQLAGKLPAAVGAVAGYMGWSAYTGDLLPTATGSISRAGQSSTQFKLCASAGCDASYASVGSGLLSVDTTTAPLTSQTYFQIDDAFSTGGYPKKATILARMRGNGLAGVKGLVIDSAFSKAGESGPRVHLRMLPDNDSHGFYLSQIDQSASSDQNVYGQDIDATAWHVFQISLSFTSATSGKVEVYLDANPVPVISQNFTSLLQATAVGQNYLRIGEEDTSGAGRGDFDWVIWTSEAAYTPEQIKGLLPSGLGTTTGY
ncbi:hypothetical protein ACFONG_15585 [Uliginosibacterium paludis]|uniref:Concanavalin A-like lectin/glucanase superfamily protein n=1 Tax=Uliginosibacterium paludis TaxID=1615952 RepID=A0ABV2CTN1_9RHOO